MFTRYLLKTTQALALLSAGVLIGASLSGHTQTYIGIAHGLSKTVSAHDGHCDICTTYHSDYTHEVTKLYGGYRRGMWALEASDGQLSRSEGGSTIVTRPSSMVGVQKSTYKAVQLLRYIRITDRLEGFAGYGRAYWTIKADEKGLNCAPEDDGSYLTFDNDTRCNRVAYQEFRHTDKGSSPIYSVGASYKLTNVISVRGWYEQTKVGGASRWIYEQTARVGWIGLQANF